MNPETTAAPEPAAKIPAATRELHGDALVCDLVLPWTDYGSRELREQTLPRLMASGVDFVSLTLASDAEFQAELFKKIARERRFILGQPDRFLLVETADDILAAKRDRSAASSRVASTPWCSAARCGRRRPTSCSTAGACPT